MVQLSDNMSAEKMAATVFLRRNSLVKRCGSAESVGTVVCMTIPERRNA